MDTEQITLKRIEPMRVAELTAIAASFGPEDIGPAIAPLYPELERRLAAAGIAATGPGIAYYEPVPGDSGETASIDASILSRASATSGWWRSEIEEAVIIHVSLPVAAGSQHEGVTLVDLPEMPEVAAILHHGPLDEADATIQTLARWVEAHGYRTDGYPREVYLECPTDDQQDWLTELQLVVRR